MPDRITITVTAGGDDADARAFRAAMGDILDVLDALAKDKVGPSQEVKWKIVGLTKMSPPSMTLECSRDISIAKTFMYGCGEIQQRPSRPFPPRAMRAIRRLGLRIRRKQIDSITLTSPGLGVVTPTEKIAYNAERAIAGKYYIIPSSVDGKLDVVNVHHRTKFSVFDDVHYREVRCYFPDHLFDAVKKNLGKRVTVVGEVKFDSVTDRPLSIRVEDIEALQENEVEPRLFSETKPIDITGGLASEQYIRRLRDGGGQ